MAIEIAIDMRSASRAFFRLWMAKVAITNQIKMQLEKQFNMA